MLRQISQHSLGARSTSRRQVLLEFLSSCACRLTSQLLLGSSTFGLSLCLLLCLRVPSTVVLVAALSIGCGHKQKPLEQRDTGSIGQIGTGIPMLVDRQLITMSAAYLLERCDLHRISLL